MKRTAPFILILALVLSLPSLTPAQNPSSKTLVLSVKFEAKGEADGEWFEKTVEAVYAPCSIWNGRFGMGSPETLLKQRVDIAGMKPDEVLQLYIIRKTGSAKDSGGMSGTCRTIGDGLFSWTVKSGNQTETGDNSGKASSNPAMGPSSLSQAEITRTTEGAILRIFEPSAEVEGYGEFFGLFDGNNVLKGLDDAMTFKLTNEELKNWASLQKSIDRTLPGSEGGTLKIKLSFHGGAEVK